MSITTAFSHLRSIRKNLLDVVEPFSLAQLNKIPTGFNNNLIWNLAHCAVTQQLLCYKLAGQPAGLSTDIINVYRKGGRPDGNVDQAFVDMIKRYLNSSIDQIEVDYKNGLFTDYSEYTTSFGVTLTSIEEAILFNNIHESMHLGTMLSMRRLI